jgi:aspartyl-tRNA(Asn)/glutamyl-tRNA(Gln) amidotransferase subunit A
MIESTVAQLEQAGAEVREIELPASFAEVIQSHRVIMSVEAAVVHKDRFERHGDDYLPKIRELIAEGMRTPLRSYVRAKWHQQGLTNAMAACFKRVDVLVTPATLGIAPDASSTGDPAFNSPWSFTGLPTVSVPCSSHPDELPWSIQLVGQRFHEVELFRHARLVECQVGANQIHCDPAVFP